MIGAVGVGGALAALLTRPAVEKFMALGLAPLVFSVVWGATKIVNPFGTIRHVKKDGTWKDYALPPVYALTYGTGIALLIWGIKEITT
jgi:hypothetical protein